MDMADEERKVVIDGIEYNLDDLSENARAQVMNLRFVSERLQHLNNELAVADTARMGYSAALKREVAKIEKK
jgi:hypothetical protein